MIADARRVLAAVAALALCTALGAERADSPASAAGEATVFAGIGVGSTVLAAIAAHGMPRMLVTEDSGPHYFWNENGLAIDATTNDDAIVRAVDVASTTGAGSLSVDLDGKRRTLAFGVLSATDADRTLTNVSDFADLQKHTRTYKVTPFTELALVFDPKTDLLQRVVFGDRGTVSLLGYLPADVVLPLHAPRDRGRPIISLAPQGLLRVDLDEKGIVRKETVLLSSGDPATDTAVVKAIDKRTYDPAKIADRRVKSSFYQGIRGIAP
jgi:hypothetical protein